MNDERAFAALTLLVAVSEQAIVELEQLDPVPRHLVEELVLIRDDATVVARGIRAPRIEVVDERPAGDQRLDAPTGAARPAAPVYPNVKQ